MQPELGSSEPNRRRLLEAVGHDFSEAVARRHVRSIERLQRRLERALGRPVAFAVAALDHLTRGPRPVAPALRVVDASEIDRLLGLARTDALTGVLNRRGLEPLLEREAARAARTHEPLSLLAVDLDDFKRVNDRHGHPWGDRALVRLAELLVSRSRVTDAVARIGGDEFVVVLPATGTEGARVLAGRIQDAIRELDLLEGCPTRQRGERVTVSIGVASGLAAEPLELVARADSALYVAKRGGRDRWSVA